MPEQVSNTEQLLQDYARERDAMVERSALRHPLKPDRLLAVVRATRAESAPATNRLSTTGESRWIPNAEIFINSEQFLVINVELAGVIADKIGLTIDGNRLMISGQRHRGDQLECSLLTTEINYGAFECVIEMPTGYELSRLKANYQNGFLRVEVPPTQPAALPHSKQQLDRLLGVSRPTRAVVEATNRPSTTSESQWIPNTEVFINREHCLVINVELAGMLRDNLELTIDGNRLMISGQRPRGDRLECSLLTTDVNYGAFECVIEIPAGYELSQAKAKYQNGFLRVEVASTQPAALPHPKGLDIEKVLLEYVQDRDRLTAQVVLKPEAPALLQPERAGTIIRNAFKQPARWLEEAWHSLLRAIGKAPKPPAERLFTVPEPRAAMIKLLEIYQPVLYAFLRHKGYAASDASDMLERFATCILDEDLGRRFQTETETGFRLFLLRAMQLFIARQTEQKKDLAATQWMTFDRMLLGAEEADSRSSQVASPEAEATFDRQWALTILNRAMTRLAQEYATAGKTEVFQNLTNLMMEGDPDYAAVAVKLGMRIGAVRALVFRLRSRLRILIREEIAQTVSSVDAIEEELRHFQSVLGQQ